MARAVAALEAARAAGVELVEDGAFDWRPSERTRPRRPEGDLRGSTTDRKRRKLWLIDTFGDGEFVACRYCWITMQYPQLTVDRIVPGHRGGRYIRSNIQPSCSLCAARQGAEIVNAKGR
jgi:5-methylcytosine-specific restriction endonuclease McrA